jgi:hypothetical protein
MTYVTDNEWRCLRFQLYGFSMISQFGLGPTVGKIHALKLQSLNYLTAYN